MTNNLSKTFKYINSHDDEIIFTYDNNYLINKPKGIDSLSINLAQSQGINQIGSIVESANVQSRPITISGIIVGDYQNEAKNKLLSTVRPDLNGKLYADNYYLDVRPTSTPTISAEPEFAKFQFELLAPYPYWSEAEKTVMNLNKIEPLFKLPCNFSKSYQFGKVLGVFFFNVVNKSQVPIPFRITLKSLGTVVNPKILNVTTNQEMRLNKTLESGEIVVIDITHDKTSVVSSVDGDIRGALDLKSNLYSLEVGDNIIKPDADSGRNELRVKLEYATEIVGVSV